MEPLNDDELNDAVSRWKAPAAPGHLRGRIFAAERRRWWAWLVAGTIRVPVPVVAAVGLLLAWFAWERPRPDAGSPAGDRQAEVTLADFEPDSEVQVRVVGDLR